MADIPPTDIRFLQQFADTNCPGHHGGELILWRPGQANALFPVRFYLRDADENDTPELTEIERCIMQAVDEHKSESPLTGQRIADLSGYSFAGHFRSTLAGLVRKGLLTNGGDGYSQVPS